MLGKIVVGGEDIDFVDPNVRNLVAEVSSTTVKRISKSLNHNMEDPCRLAK